MIKDEFVDLDCIGKRVNFTEDEKKEIRLKMKLLGYEESSYENDEPELRLEPLCYFWNIPMRNTEHTIYLNDDHVSGHLFDDGEMINVYISRSVEFLFKKMEELCH